MLLKCTRDYRYNRQITPYLHLLIDVTLNVLEIGKIATNPDDGFVVDFVNPINVVEAGQRSIRNQLIGSNNHTVGKFQSHHGGSRRDRSATVKEEYCYIRITYDLRNSNRRSI